MNKHNEIHLAQRMVNEWLEHLSGLDPSDERFMPSLVSFREAIALRNRLELKGFIPYIVDEVKASEDNGCGIQSTA